MALSNIFDEPQREITETLIGFGALCGGGWLDYRWATWCLNDYVPKTPQDLPYSGALILTMVIGLLAVIGFWIALLIVHALGDFLCDELEIHGIKLRPRRPWED